MSMTYSRASQIPRRMKATADRVKALRREIKDVLKFNSDASIDWGAQAKPATVDEDQAGNLDGFDFSRVQLANLIGTLAAIDTLLDTGHGGNVNAVASADA